MKVVVGYLKKTLAVMLSVSMVAGTLPWTELAVTAAEFEQGSFAREEVLGKEADAEDSPQAETEGTESQGMAVDTYVSADGTDQSFWEEDEQEMVPVIAAEEITETISMPAYGASGTYGTVYSTEIDGAQKPATGDCGADASDSLTWTIYDGGEDASGTRYTLVISGTGAMKNYAADADNRAPWYEFLDNMSTSGNLGLVLEDGITYIGNYAFSPSQRTVGTTVLYGAQFSGTLRIPDTVTGIGSNAFQYNVFTGDLVIPDSVESIGDWAFGSERFNILFAGGNIVIGYGLKTMGVNVFSGWSVSGLSYANLSSTLYNLSSLSIGSSISYLWPKEGTVYTITKHFNDAKGSSDTRKVLPDAVLAEYTQYHTFPGTSDQVGDFVFDWYTDAEYQNQITKRDSFTADMDVYGKHPAVEGAEYGIRLAGGDCGAAGSDVQWAVYDSYDADSKGDTLVISGTGAMADYSSRDAVPWFSADYDFELRCLVLKEGLTHLGDYAFYGTTSGNAVTGFEGELTVPSTVQSVGAYCFSYNNFSGTLALPEGLESVGDYAFHWNKFTGTLILPQSLRTIGASGFGGANYYSRNQFSAVVVPEGVTSIGSSAFPSGRYSYYNFSQAEFKAYWVNEVDIRPTDGMLHIYRHYDDSAETVTSRIALPKGIVDLSVYPDYEKYCTFPNELDQEYYGVDIVWYQDEGCTQPVTGTITDFTEDVHFYVKSNRTGEYYAVEPLASGECGAQGDNVTWVLVSNEDDSSQDSYTLVISGSGEMKDFTGPSDIPWWYYNGNQINWKITQVKMESGITHIGDYAFWLMSYYSGFELPDTVQSIGNYAFYSSGNWTHVDVIAFPEGLVSVGEKAFANSGSDIWYGKLLILPESLKTVGAQAFNFPVSGMSVIVGSQVENFTAFELPHKYNSNCGLGIYNFSQVAFSNSLNQPLYTITKQCGDGDSAVMTTRKILPADALPVASYPEETYPELVKYRTFPSELDGDGAQGEWYSDAAMEQKITQLNDVTADVTVYAAHAWTEYIIDQEATCTEEGSKSIHCKNCGARKDVTAIPAKGHTPGEAVRENEAAATCTEAGSYEAVISCTVCGEEISRTRKTIEALGHDWGEWTVTKAATEEAEGEEQRVCGHDVTHTETRAIAKLPHTLIETEAEAATCEESGNIAYYTCSGCGKIFSDSEGKIEITIEDTVTAALGHDWDEGEVTTPAGCETDGEMTYTCKHDASHTKTEVIRKTGHSLEKVAGVDATCTATGNIEYYVCSVCHKWYRDAAGEEEIKDHDSVVISMTEHKAAAAVRENVAAADCETDGSYDSVEYCSVCGKELSRTPVKIDALGHDWGDWTVVKAATEEAEGREQRVCGHDETHVETRAIAKLEHNLVKTDAKAATCTEDGNIAYYTCSGCGKLFSDNKGQIQITLEQTIVSALGHDWGEWTVVKAATEEAEGEEQRVCGHDETHVETRTIPVLSHVHDLQPVEAKAATCEEGGNPAYYICSGCARLFEDADGEKELSIEDIVIKALGHDWDEGQITTPAGCETDGEMAYICKRDVSHTKTEIIEKTGHKEAEPVKENEIAPGCETDGSYDSVVYCFVCGKELSRTTVKVKALGHDWGEWTVTKEAADTEKGEEQRVCSHDASHVETRVIPEIGHEHTLVETQAVEATCTEAGNITYYVCTDCGRYFIDSAAQREIEEKQTVIAALSHAWGEWTVTKEATYVEDGEEQRVCANDPTHVEQRVIDKLPHEHLLQVVEAKEADCENPGNKAYAICSVCGKWFEEIDANGSTTDGIDKVDGNGSTMDGKDQEDGRIQNVINVDGKLWIEIKDHNSVDIPAKGHTEEEPVQENIIVATCEQEGSYDSVVKCAVCGKELSRATQKVAALGHDWGDWTVTKAATEMEAGQEQRVCSHDETHVETRVIPKLQHVHTLIKHDAKEATETEAGNIEYWECSGCGRLFADAKGQKEISLEDIEDRGNGGNGGSGEGGNSGDGGNECNGGNSGEGGNEGTGDGSDAGITPAGFYRVTFYVDGAVYQTVTVADGDTVDISQVAAPTSVSGAFSGWYVSGTKTLWDETLPVTESLKLEARFTAGTSGSDSSGGSTGQAGSTSGESAMDAQEDVSAASGTLYLVKGQKFSLGEGSWTSSDSKSLAISKKNEATAKKEADGITIKAADVNKEYKVAIVTPKLSEAKCKLIIGDNSKVLNITGLGASNKYAGEYPVYWTSSNAEIVKVGGGKLYPMGKGTATVTAYVNGKAYNCKVSVVEASTIGKLGENATFTLTPMQTVAPKFTSGFQTKKAVEWSSTVDGAAVTVNAVMKKNGKVDYYENGIVKITPAGKLTAIGAGTTTLTAKDASGNTQSFTVTVSAPATRILYVNAGATKAVKFYNVKPAALDFKMVSSDGASAASAGTSTGAGASNDSNGNSGKAELVNGKLKGISAGRVILTADYKPCETQTGKGFTYKVTVYVEEPSLTTGNGLIQKSGLNYELALKKGEAYVLRSKAVYQPVLYKSSKAVVAFVDEAGVITARSAGKTKLTTKINGKKVTVNVVVTE